MPRFLAIDWQGKTLAVLSASASKGRSRVEASLEVPLADELTPATASAAGRMLKDALAGAGIAAAPVVVAIGRDKTILKEIAIPFAAAQDEAMVVRFQAAKELSESAHEVVYDYALFDRPVPGRTTRTHLVVVRRSIVAAAAALCQSAGLKLHAVVPRPFALAGLLDRRSSNAMAAVRGLLVPATGDDVDFCVFASDRLEWARTLTAGADLASEIRKNAMLLAAQKGELPPIAHIATPSPTSLGDVGVPVEPLDPWVDGDSRPTKPLAFLGALGAAEAAARPAGLPINLAAPKEPKPVVDVGRRRARIAGIAAAVVLPLLLFAWWMNLSAKRAAIRELQEAKEELDESWKRLEQERIDVAALKEWEQTSISWLDEIYDLSARLPHAQGLRVTQLSATQMRRRGAKDAFTGAITIHGLTTGDQDTLVSQLLEAIQQDKYLKAQSPTFKANEFTIKVDVAPRPPIHYQARVVAPPEAKKATSPTPSAKTEEAADE